MTICVADYTSNHGDLHLNSPSNNPKYPPLDRSDFLLLRRQRRIEKAPKGAIQGGALQPH